MEGWLTGHRGGPDDFRRDHAREDGVGQTLADGSAAAIASSRPAVRVQIRMLLPRPRIGRA